MKKNVKTNDDPTLLAETEEGDLLGRLTDRVDKAVATIQKLKKERDALQKRLAEVENQLQEAGVDGEELADTREELERYRSERDEVRTRIGGMLESLASLDEEGP
jgi:uncharacterized coiled-coil DUF342 family protein